MSKVSTFYGVIAVSSGLRPKYSRPECNSNSNTHPLFLDSNVNTVYLLHHNKLQHINLDSNYNTSTWIQSIYIQ